MDLSEHGLVYQKKAERLVASIRQPAAGREEILALLKELSFFLDQPLYKQP